ncbi:MAG: glycosyltransferase family 2 protein [Candidatus Beckwithbacteria bacterium]
MKVSAIIPCYNEEKTITQVVKVLLGCKLIDEVVVVNDGSTDKSLAKLKPLTTKITLINLKKNSGKGAALAAGIKKAQGEVLLFIDADVINLKPKNIQVMLEPVLKHQWRGVIGIRKKGWLLPAPFAKLSGERVYYKTDLLPFLKEMHKTRFGIEIFLNHCFAKQPIKKVKLLKLYGLYKHEKRPPTQAIKEYLEEGVEIAKEIAKQEKLRPEDIQIINRLKKAKTFKELKEVVEKISNLKVREYLNKYVLKYLELARQWWEKW